MRLGALDAGSNTVHLLVADATPEGLVEVGHHVEMPELGAGVARSGRIGVTRGRRAIAAMLRMAGIAEQLECQELVVGATAAVRKAEDGQEFLERAAEALGRPVRLISGAREAELSFAGVASRQAPRGEWLMGDLGGGSLELVVGRAQEMVRAATLPLGSGALAATFLGDPPDSGQRARLRRAALRELVRAPESDPERLVLTGGTASNLPLLLSKRSPPLHLTSADLLTAEARLDAEPAQRVAERYGLKVARVRALRGGVEIVLLLLDWYGLDRLNVSHEGLRHGMLLAFLERGQDWWRERAG
jgi:exopolyphosphatase/guanosine-5'-triphosphate,3'-diphosphate pyrophosphatase